MSLNINLIKTHIENEIYQFNNDSINGCKNIDLLSKADILVPQYLIFNFKLDNYTDKFIDYLELSNFKISINNNIIN